MKKVDTLELLYSIEETQSQGCSHFVSSTVVISKYVVEIG